MEGFMWGVREAEGIWAMAITMIHRHIKEYRAGLVKKIV
jgi:hypothetical protein